MPRRLAGHVTATIVGILAGTLVALVATAAIESDDRAPETSQRSSAESPRAASTEEVVRTPARTARRPPPRLLLAWSTGGLPAATEAVLERMRAVRGATTVSTGTDWMRRSQDANGTAAERTSPGFLVPLESALIEPREFAAFVAPSERADVLALGEGDAVLSETSARLRGAEPGSRLHLIDRTVTVRAVVSDVSASGYEMLVAGGTPASWRGVDRFVLLHLAKASARDAVERRLRDLLGPGQVFRVRARGETPFLRYGDAVLPQILIKETFGEFAARPLPDGRVVVDPRWRRTNILEARVPVLGRITCHRALLPQLRAALQEVVAEGLAFTINTGQFGGCFGPRFIGLEPLGRLSHHAWGAAIDLNVAENAFGTPPDQDPRLVEIFERHGFTWGGRWLIPDGMHFEWVRFP